MMRLPLHAYQEPAVDRFLASGRLLLAFDMGLGKTAIAIACAEELFACGDADMCLLVVPASLRYQWAQALVKFTDVPARTIKVRSSGITVPDERACIIADGGPARRREQLRRAADARPDYVIVSYETVVSDTRLVRRLNAGFTVLDEASAIKGFGSQRTLTIKRALQSEFRLALTGTPVENKPEEAFSIMEWVDPGVLGAFDLFERTYIQRWPNGTVRKYKNIPLLNARLSEGMIRRSRHDPDVASYLPEVDYGQWLVGLDARTQEIYDAIARDLLDALLAVRGGDSFDLAAYYSGQGYSETTGLGKVMARQQAIELLLDHPELFRISAERWAAGDGEGSRYCADHLSYLDGGVARCCKLAYLTGKLEQLLLDPANKILVFSRYPRMLRLIAEAIGHGSVLYHGEMSAAQKAAAYQQFAADPDCRLFLSSHAGAYGTDMHMANYLINYDLPWSGGVRDQINGRHQRVSSEFGKVCIRDLIVAGTIEERKLMMLDYKQRVAQAVVEGRTPQDGRINNDLVTLTEFLQSC